MATVGVRMNYFLRPGDDPRATAIECAALYENVALNGDGHTVTIEMSDVFLPSALRGFDVAHVQLVPVGRPGSKRLEFVFTTTTPTKDDA